MSQHRICKIYVILERCLFELYVVLSYAGSRHELQRRLYMVVYIQNNVE